MGIEIIKFIIQHNSQICGTLIYSEDNIERVGTINMISIEEEYRRKGMGTALLWNLYDYTISKGNISYILLDDCSDNFRMKNNIYTKLGATYIDKTGPEMIWKIYSNTIKKKRLEYESNKIYNISILCYIKI